MTTDVSRIRAVLLMLEELKKAEAKHPEFPKDHIYQAAILAEECGEAIKDALDEKFVCPTKYDDFLVEVAQVGAVAIRILADTGGGK